jgi:hypothetical protein
VGLHQAAETPENIRALVSAVEGFLPKAGPPGSSAAPPRAGGLSPESFEAAASRGIDEEAVAAARADAIVNELATLSVQ